MREKFASELKAAMKAGEKRRVGTIRMIMAALKDKEIEARGQGKAVSDEEILALLQKMTKSRKEFAGDLRKSGPRRPRPPRKRGNRDHPGLFAATAERGGSGAGDCRRHCRDGRCLGQGHGTRGRRAQGTICGPDGFCESQRAREENAWRIRLTAWPSERSRVRPRPCETYSPWPENSWNGHPRHRLLPLPSSAGLLPDNAGCDGN